MNFALPAGSSGSRSMENLEKQLVCPVCLEMFSKPVVILPCQHNLCRKCASDILQSANPVWQSRIPLGSRFRCPSCRHEVVLDRHGVFGLQRNLLVENIIDIYRQQEVSRPVKPEQRLMCGEHEEEKINIYCLSCQLATCSMCKVFGPHRDCDVAPLSSVYTAQKTVLSDSIAVLVASNDHTQAVISRMEDTRRSVEENGQKQRENLDDHFHRLVVMLEERKQQLVAIITKHQDEKLKHTRSLIRRHSDQLENAATLVESAIQTMEEAHMSVFIQHAEVLLEKMAGMIRTSRVQRPEIGFESMSRFTVETENMADMLRNMDFCSAAGEEDDSDEEDSD